jgi:hypothetical protein
MPRTIFWSSVYLSCCRFDETVFPFSELHSNAGARLRQKILLIPNHLLNLGDALTNENVTNGQPSSQTVLQATEKIRHKMVIISCTTHVMAGCT